MTSAETVAGNGGWMMSKERVYWSPKGRTLRKRVSMVVAVIALAVLPSRAHGQTQETVLFRLDFQQHMNPGYRVTFPRSGANPITTSLQPGRGTNWNYTHFASGGWNDRAFVRFYWPRTFNQGSCGFYFSPNAGQPAGGWYVNAPYYIRLRLRAVTPVGDGGTVNNKFLLWNQGSGGDERIMLHMSNGANSRAGIINPVGTDATHFGFNGSRNIGPPAGNGWDGAGKALRIADGWHHVQFAFQMGSNPYWKMWANNNDFNNPDDVSPGFTSSWSIVPDGMGAFNIGSFLTDPPGSDVLWDLMDLEIGTAFNPSWAATSSTAPPPQPPTNVRVVRQQAMLGAQILAVSLVLALRRRSRSERES